MALSDPDDDLTAKIEKVIADHVANNGGLPGGWVLLAQYTDEEGVPSWAYRSPEGQNLYETQALVAWLGSMVDHERRTYWTQYDREHEDDDG